MTIAQRLICYKPLDFHAPRMGTRCKCCTKKIGGMNAYHTVTPVSPSAYICPICADIHDLSEDVSVPNFQGQATKKGSLLAITWRATKLPSLEQRVYLSASYQVVFYQKGKSTYYAVPQTALSLHGAKDIFAGMEGFKPEGIQQISIGKRPWDISDYNRIRDNASGIFKDLFGYFSECPDIFRGFFGCSWMRPNFLRFEVVPVFSFPYGNKNVFFHRISFIEDISSFLDEWLRGEHDTITTSQRILKKFKRYAMGKEQVQKASRNKGWNA